MIPPLKTILLGKDESAPLPEHMVQLIPSKMYVFPEGTRDNRPSLGLIMSTGNGQEVVIAQLSVGMLFNSFNDTTRNLFEKEWARLKGETLASCSNCFGTKRIIIQDGIYPCPDCVKV